MENFKKGELPKFKSEEEKEKFFRAVGRIENAQGQNPKEKYRTGSIKGFSENATNEDGEYQPYMDNIIDKTKEELDKIYKEMEKDDQSTFKLSGDHFDPNSSIKRSKELNKDDDKK